MPPSPFELLNQHLDVSHETFERLSVYHDLLLKWQPKINLVGPDTIKDSWCRHFLDSLQLVKHNLDLFRGGNKAIIDMGSGAGFPGLVMAVYGVKNIHLIESDARKIAFLREVARLTKTEVEIHHCRIENQPIKPDIIVSRACSPLDKLLSLSHPFVSRETICLFHKGKNYITELEDAKLHWQFEVAITPSVVDEQSVIIKLSHIGEHGHGNKKSDSHS